MALRTGTGRSLAAIFVCALGAGTPACRQAGPAMRASLPIPSDLGLDRSTGTAVLVGAGDIAICGFVNSERTARLLDGIEGIVFTLGDNVYPNGTAAEFAQCYEPSWGRHRFRTRPAPGNHDYNTPGAGPYFEYFGLRAGPPGRGYYAFTAGAWRVISLNSNIDASIGSAQYEWLKRELEDVPARCRAAYWHHSVFSSGFEANTPQMRDVWRLLYEHGTDIVMSAHAHDYERFAPQDPEGRPDPRGIRQFVVGTGGAGLTAGTQRQANSEVFDSASMGVLKLTLHPGSYEWQFVPIPQATFTDVGAGICT